MSPVTVGRRALLGAAATLGGAACARPDTVRGRAAASLLVASATDATVTAVELPGGAHRGTARVAGVPVQVAAGMDDSALVIVEGAGRQASLIELAPGRDVRGMWGQRVLPLGAADAPTYDALLACDGGRWAAVAARVGSPAGPRSSVWLVDTSAGRVSTAGQVCGTGESVRSLAVTSSDGTPVVYVGLEGGGGSGAGSDSRDGTQGRVVVRSRTGAVSHATAPRGVPAGLAVGRWEGSPGLKLYCLEAPGEELAALAGQPGRLLVLNAGSLTQEAEHEVDVSATRVSVAPEGDAAYLLAGDVVVEVSPAGGGSRRLARLPERGLALLATAEHVYVAGAYGSHVWEIERRSGRRTNAIAVARGPVALAAS